MDLISASVNWVAPPLGLFIHSSLWVS
jgi:hypothetical protein